MLVKTEPLIRKTDDFYLISTVRIKFESKCSIDGKHNISVPPTCRDDHGKLRRSGETSLSCFAARNLF